LVAAAKFLVEATKNKFVVPNFVAVTKPFFSVPLHWYQQTYLTFRSLLPHVSRHILVPFLYLASVEKGRLAYTAEYNR